ncbi:hypothetical protein EYF80_038674 [Liparis tanakae]|uniref:Uncharacterized protein n=1 Tax=Liparis tanakae TaxID=230148 RepID=A0A4Z2GC09_9TELE|nr:hypothetical protein EYF80_038674 [Liparis tanakae]
MKCMCPSAPVTITSIQMRMASGDGATMKPRHVLSVTASWKQASGLWPAASMWPWRSKSSFLTGSFTSLSTSFCLLLVSSCSRFSSSSLLRRSSSRACRRTSISRSCTRPHGVSAHSHAQEGVCGVTRCSRRRCFSTCASRRRRSISSIFAMLEVLALMEKENTQGHRSSCSLSIRVISDSCSPSSRAHSTSICRQQHIEMSLIFCSSSSMLLTTWILSSSMCVTSCFSCSLSKACSGYIDMGERSRGLNLRPSDRSTEPPSPQLASRIVDRRFLCNFDFPPMSSPDLPLLVDELTLARWRLEGEAAALLPRLTAGELDRASRSDAAEPAGSRSTWPNSVHRFRMVSRRWHSWRQRVSSSHNGPPFPKDNLPSPKPRSKPVPSISTPRELREIRLDLLGVPGMLAGTVTSGGCSREERLRRCPAEPRWDPAECRGDGSDRAGGSAALWSRGRDRLCIPRLVREPVEYFLCRAASPPALLWE